MNTRENLLYRLIYGQLTRDDIPLARAWQAEDPEGVPIWVGAIAGGNPAKLAAVQEIARDELAHELLGD